MRANFGGYNPAQYMVQDNSMSNIGNRFANAITSIPDAMRKNELRQNERNERNINDAQNRDLFSDLQALNSQLGNGLNIREPYSGEKVDDYRKYVENLLHSAVNPDGNFDERAYGLIMTAAERTGVMSDALQGKFDEAAYHNASIGQPANRIEGGAPELGAAGMIGGGSRGNMYDDMLRRELRGDWSSAPDPMAAPQPATPEAPMLPNVPGSPPVQQEPLPMTTGSQQPINPPMMAVGQHAPQGQGGVGMFANTPETQSYVDRLKNHIAGLENVARVSPSPKNTNNLLAAQRELMDIEQKMRAQEQAATQAAETARARADAERARLEREQAEKDRRYNLDRDRLRAQENRDATKAANDAAAAARRGAGRAGGTAGSEREVPLSQRQQQLQTFVRESRQAGDNENADLAQKQLEEIDLAIRIQNSRQTDTQTALNIASRMARGKIVNGQSRGSPFVGGRLNVGNDRVFNLVLDLVRDNVDSEVIMQEMVDQVLEMIGLTSEASLLDAYRNQVLDLNRRDTFDGVRSGRITKGRFLGARENTVQQFQNDIRRAGNYMWQADLIEDLFKLNRIAYDNNGNLTRNGW